MDAGGQVYLAVRGVAGAAVAAAVLAFLGYAPAWALCRGALVPYRLVLSPLLGWMALSTGGYVLLTGWTFGPAFAVLLGAATVGNAAALAASWLRPAPVGGRWRLGLGRQGALALVAGLVLLVALVPHVYHGSLALLVPNQDDEFYVNGASHLWKAPAGWRLALDAYRLEPGWAYQLLLSALEAVPILDPFEAMPVAGYVALALAVPPTAILFHRELRLPWGWAVGGAGAAAVHGLVLWTPGYGFGPNAVAIAATPFAVLAASRAVRLGDRRSLILAGAAMALLLMSYAKVTLVLLAFMSAGVALTIAGASRRWRIVRRATALGLLGAALGGCAVYDAAAWGLSNAGGLLLDPDQTTGTGWGWRDIPSAAVWLGTDSWSLIAPSGVGEGNVGSAVLVTVAFLGTGAAIALAVCGVVSLRRVPYRPLLGVLLGCVLFPLGAHLLDAFPYAVFKIYSLTAFLVVGVCLRGVIHARKVVAGWRPAALVLRRPLGVAIPTAALAVYAVAYGTASLESVAFYLQPWGPLLSAAALDEVGQVTRAVPPGSRVLISGSFLMPVAPERAAVRDHPIAFHSLWSARRAGAARLRSVLSHHLDRSGVGVAGIFERPAGYTVSPAEQYDYVVTGADEDGAFFGVGESARVAGGKVVSLYRYAHPGTLDASQMGGLIRRTEAGEPSAVLVSCDRAVRPVENLEDGLPGGASECGRARVLVGLVAPRAGPVVVRVASPRGLELQSLYLSTGLVWYTTPTIELPAVISASPASADGEAGAARVYVAGVTALPADEGAPPRLRTTAGGAALFDLRVESGAAVLEVWYASATAPRDLRVSLVTGAVGAGKGFATDADPGRAFQAWRWRIRPDQPPEQAIDGRPVALQSGSAWPAQDGQHWVRLQFWRGQDLWLEVPIGYAEARQGRFVSARTVSSVVNVPMPEPVPAPPLLAPGALLRGDGEHVFLVESGRLRWVPTLDAFQRRGFAWQQVQAVDAAVLARWPVGLPLD